MDPTALYYLFSTIAQRLAAALALLAAFMVTRMNDFNTLIYGHIVRFYEEAFNDPEITRLFSRGDAPGMYSHLNSKTEKLSPKTHTTKIRLVEMGRLLERRGEVIHKVRAAVLVAIPAIVASLVALALARGAARSVPLSWTITAAGVLWSGWCLWSFYQLIDTALREYWRRGAAKKRQIHKTLKRAGRYRGSLRARCLQAASEEELGIAGKHRALRPLLGPRKAFTLFPHLLMIAQEGFPQCRNQARCHSRFLEWKPAFLQEA